MDYVTLGRTGLKASVMGLGAGGASRLGQGTGKTEAESVAVVREALDAGVNFIDTAESYGNEEIIGKAIDGRDRGGIIVSTKKTSAVDGRPVRADELSLGLDSSLRRLGTDHVDVYHLHGVAVDHYDYAAGELVPEMLKLKAAGKIRFLGITEAFGSDSAHRTLSRAVQDDCWDVMMVGFNILNQCARERVFAEAIRKRIGILVMFAVRRAFSDPERLGEIMDDLARRGRIDSDPGRKHDSLGFLVHEAGGATGIPDAAYRFCRYEPGVHVVLSGTGDPVHLRANLESLSRPPLPAADIAKLRDMFVRVDDVSGG